jgi:hypothetical protein
LILADFSFLFPSLVDSIARACQIARTELYLSGRETNWNDFACDIQFAIEAEISGNRYSGLVKSRFSLIQIYPVGEATMFVWKRTYY